MSDSSSRPNPLPTVGQRVRVTALPSYLKTADPMPMLRPPSAIAVGEVGIILARQPGESWSVRFASGAYLLDRGYFEIVEATDPPASPEDEGAGTPTADAPQ